MLWIIGEISKLAQELARWNKRSSQMEQQAWKIEQHASCVEALMTQMMIYITPGASQSNSNH